MAATATASPLLTLPSSADDLDRIERALRDSVRTDDAYLTEIASHLILAGGKRLRPLLAAVSARAVTGEAIDDVVQGGVAVELVHIGSLYHDDVMDEAVTRRSVDSVNARWGNLRAILAGDFLLARASEIAASLGVEVAGLLGHTIGRLCEGEIGQLRSTFDPARTKDAYLSSIRGKTASLFATSCRSGGIVADIERNQIEAVTAYGQAFGMVFQIADDVLDLTASEEELGKPSGHDLVEGVYTLPVIFTLAAGGAPAEELGELLGRPIHGAELDKALSIVRSGPGVAKAIKVGRHFADVAREALVGLPETPTAAAMAAAPHALLDTLTP